jgi:hypothetical protein
MVLGGPACGLNPEPACETIANMALLLVQVSLHHILDMQ